MPSSEEFLPLYSLIAWQGRMDVFYTPADWRRQSGSGQKEDTRNFRIGPLYCSSHALDRILWFRWMRGDKPPVSWRERTSHVTRHFPATNNVDSKKIDHSFMQPTNRVLYRCLPVRPLTIYAVIYVRGAYRKVGGRRWRCKTMIVNFFVMDPVRK